MVASARIFNVATWALYSIGVVVVVWVRGLVLDQDFSEVDELARLLETTRSSFFSDPQLARQLESVRNFDKERLWPFNSSKDVKGYLIHVGKAGGSSLVYRLNVRDAIPILPCRMNSTNQEQEESCIKRKDKSILKQRLYASFHTFNSRYKPAQKQWLRNNTNLLIFTARDPVDRVVSAFNFHRHNYLNGRDRRPVTKYGKRKLGYQIYFECFSTVEDLAMALSENSLLSGSTTESCRELARDLIDGKVEPTVCPHLFWNYQYYAGALQWGNQTKTVAVIRTEALWHDVARLEYLLGGDPKQFLEPEKQIQYTHGSERFEVTRGVSKEGAISLCCSMRKELKVYHDLVALAVNLDTDEKVQTLRSLMHHCGVNKNLQNDAILSWRWGDWIC